MADEAKPAVAKEELAELLKFVREQTEAGVTSGKALVSQQAPLVVHEIVAYKRAQGGVMLVCIALVLAFSVRLIRRSMKADDSDTREMLQGMGFMGLIVTILMTALSSGLLLKPFLAPRLVVLDYVRGLL
jgi:hypothetical protein